MTTTTAAGRAALAATIMAGTILATAAIVPPALAHHGWSWAEADQIELAGTIREVYIGPPHPVLTVEAADGATWTVELGNPRQTAGAGFDEAAAAVGDRVVALGNRSSDLQERRMKAVRVTVGDRTYDIYPDRIRK